MKVKCTQCGKVFEVPDTQKQRALKCICKNIFLAVPILGKAGEKQEEAVAIEESSRASPQITHNPAMGYDHEIDTRAPENEETDEGLREYVSFLKNSRVQTQKEATPPPQPPRIMKTIELDIDEDSSKSEGTAELAPEESIEEYVSDFQSADDHLIVESEKQPKETREDLAEKRRFSGPAAKKDNKPFIFAAGAVAIALSLILAFFLNSPVEEKKEMDPYITKLLTPATEVVPAQPLPTPKIFPPRTKAVIEVLPPEKIPPLKAKLLLATFNGDFENVVRLASTANHLDDEESALFMEALIERARNEVPRHRELKKKIDQEKAAHPGSSALMRTTALSILKDPSRNTHLTQISQAIEILKSLALTRATDPLVHAYLGSIYEHVHRLDLAHRAWDEALTRAPNFVRLIEHRERLYRSQKKYSEALVMTELLSHVSDHEREGFEKMAELYELKEDRNSAASAYKKALKSENSASLHLALGRILSETNAESAIKEFEAGLKAEPNRIEKRDLFIEIGRARCDQKNFEAASQAFKAAISEDQHSVKTAIEKEKCELAAGAFRTASSTIEKALKLSPNHPQLWYDYGYALSKQDKQKAALAALKRAIELKATDKSHFMIAQVLVGMQKRQEASVHLKKALQINPKNKEARSLLKSLN